MDEEKANVVRQVWPVKDGEIVLELRLDRPVPGYALHGMSDVADALGRLSVLLTHGPPAHARRLPSGV